MRPRGLKTRTIVTAQHKSEMFTWVLKQWVKICEVNANNCSAFKSETCIRKRTKFICAAVIS